MVRRSRHILSRKGHEVDDLNNPIQVAEHPNIAGDDYRGEEYPGGPNQRWSKHPLGGLPYRTATEHHPDHYRRVVVVGVRGVILDPVRGVEPVDPYSERAGGQESEQRDAAHASNVI